MFDDDEISFHKQMSPGIVQKLVFAAVVFIVFV